MYISSSYWILRFYVDIMNFIQMYSDCTSIIFHYCLLELFFLPTFEIVYIEKMI